jgi:ribosome biogenesis GTPase
MAKKKKIRADFRKNRNVRARPSDWTQRYKEHGFQDETPPQCERISGKGDLVRRRTICGDVREDESSPGFGVHLDVNESVCQRGRVLRVLGLLSVVEAEDGTLYQCATRRLLKTLTTDQRHVVAAGDYVFFRPVGNTEPKEGVIERVEPRHGCICREVRGRQHVLVANVDQLAIVTSVAEPHMKPNLIDRLLIEAEKAGVQPLICINKVDLADTADLQPLVGVYSQMGYNVLLLSARSGLGIERLRRAMQGRATVVAGQSGVGKSSLLNDIDPGFQLRVQTVSKENEKGRHTTTTAQLLPLAGSGYVVDTPGIRQFRLWDVTREEVAGFFRDIRPYISLCHFPNCTHTHEDHCAVKDAVADGQLDERRYESYCHLLAGDME